MSDAVREPLRLGMIGGGEGAYIGSTHRLAARQSGAWQLVAGAFDADPDRGARFAAGIGITDRAYADVAALLAGERRRPDPVDAVAICTPNHTHYAIARACLEAGFDVICEKPMTTRLADALALEALVDETGRFFGLCHTYAAYPMVHQARHLVASGALGAIRLVQAEYQHQWMARAVERAGSAQAQWRTDPAQSGRGGAIADIGTHAYQLAGFVTGLELSELLSDTAAFVPGRSLDDAAHVMMRYAGGARGLLWCSQVSAGCANTIRLRVVGDEAGLLWSQEAPDELIYTHLDGDTTILRRGAAGLCEAARVRSNTPPGHVEGYLEAFTNLYAGFAEAIRARRARREPEPIGRDLPGVSDGVRGVAWIDAVADCAEADAPRWTRPARA